MSLFESLLDGKALDSLLAAGWSAPAGPLAIALGAAEKRCVLGAKDVLNLEVEGSLRLILSGSVDIFLTDSLGRYPMGRLPAGALAGFFSPDESGRCIIGIPSAEAEIVTIAEAALLDTAAETANLVTSAWQLWFDVLGVWLPAGQKPASAKEASGFAAAVRAAVIEHREVDAIQRLAQQVAADRQIGRDLASGLSGMIDLIGVRGHSSDVTEEATVAEAAALVLLALGTEEPEFRRQTVTSLDESLRDIASDNRMMLRTVELPENWWTLDLGPLVATCGPEGSPCALLHSGNCYRLHFKGQVHLIDKVVAASIDRIAYMFYLALPEDEPLTPIRLLRFGLRGSRRDIVAIGWCLFLTGLFTLTTPIALDWLMNPIIPDAERGQVSVIGNLLVLLAMGATSAFIVESLATLRIEALADNRVQAAIWVRLLNLETDFFRRFTAGDLANRADGINAMRKLASQSLAAFASGGIATLFSLGLMVYYNWILALVVFCLALLFDCGAYFAGRSILRYNFASLELAGQIQGTVLQFLGAVAKLRVAGAERLAFLKWLFLYRKTVALSLRQREASNRLLLARSAFDPLVVTVALVVLGLHSGDLFALFRADNVPSINRPLMTTADFVCFNVALGQFIAGMMSLTRAGLFFVMLQPHWFRAKPIIEAKEEANGKGNRVSDFAGHIELRDVRFRYAPDTPLVLRGISMDIPAGSFVAIVGSSGAGKSSITRLLLGFDTPEAGDILIDGTDLRLLDLKDVRQRYGVVLQHGQLLAGSIYDNIALGLQATEADVMEALRIADLEVFVNTLPMGLQTNIAEAGATLSGGQRQRLMIARAVIRKPGVLIMDEATSALDNITQKNVVDRLRALKCTQIVIAQRLSTIAAADIIYVLDQGRVVESGSYLQLLTQGPLFKKMMECQAL